MTLQFSYTLHVQNLQAGTGKTFTTKEIVQQLKNRNKEVAITTSTGIAGEQFRGFGNDKTQTLHK